MLSKKNRLKDKALIARLLKNGKTIQCPFGLMRYEVKEDDPAQLTVIVSRKVESSAARRNKIRRRITEAMRQNLSHLNKPVNAVFITRKPSKDLAFTEIEKGLIECFQKLN